MSNTLVAYFSATGTTETAAELLAKAAGADLYEILPAQPYTKADLDWNDKNSRTTKECADPACRPPLGQPVPDMSGYDVVYVGFPIWWYKEAPIVDTFLDACDLNGKTVVPFATSGGSPLGQAQGNVAGNAPGATTLRGGMMNPASRTTAQALVDSVAAQMA